MARSELDACPPDCDHVAFHYCVNGTHCDKHCACSCRMCVEERRIVAAVEAERRACAARCAEFAAEFAATLPDDANVARHLEREILRRGCACPPRDDDRPDERKCCQWCCPPQAAARP